MPRSGLLLLLLACVAFQALRIVVTGDEPTRTALYMANNALRRALPSQHPGPHDPLLDWCAHLILFNDVVLVVPILRQWWTTPR